MSTGGNTSAVMPLVRRRSATETVLRAIGAAVLMAGKATALAFSIEPVLHPKARKFHGKAMRIRALGYFGMLLAVPVGWLASGRRVSYPIGADLALTVPLLLDSGGNALGIYDSDNIDDLVHFTNTAILSTAFGVAISPHVDSRWKAGAATTAFGVTGELAWELMEYTADAIGFDGLNLSRADTLGDIGEAVLGAILAGAITTIRWKASDDRSPASDDRSPASDDRSPASDDRSPASDDRSPASDDRSPAATPGPGRFARSRRRRRSADLLAEWEAGRWHGFRRPPPLTPDTPDPS
jgi:hypothetical protein